MHFVGLSEMNDKGLFNKLMVIQAGSIVEAALGQIIYRAQNFNREGVPNITEEDRKKIKNTEIEKFNNILQAMKRYKILDDLGGKIYDELHDLRKYRNKIHIQDDVDIEVVARDEDAAFSEKLVASSLELCIRVLKYLNDKYRRPTELKSSVKNADDR